MSTKTATFVKDVSTDFRGTAHLFRLDPPVTYRNYTIDGTVALTSDHVIVSAADVPFSGPETYIFPANTAGGIADWGELEGSFRGGLDIEEALGRAGYEVVR